MSLEYYCCVKLLTEHHLEFLNLNGVGTVSSESTHVKMPHCWKPLIKAQIRISYDMFHIVYHLISMSVVLVWVLCHKFA